MQPLEKYKQNEEFPDDSNLPSNGWRRPNNLLDGTAYILALVFCLSGGTYHFSFNGKTYRKKVDGLCSPEKKKDEEGW